MPLRSFPQTDTGTGWEDNRISSLESHRVATRSNPDTASTSRFIGIYPADVLKFQVFPTPHFVEQCPRIFWIICFQYLAETSAAGLLEQSRLSLDRTPPADCPLMRTGQCTFPNRALLETTRPFPQCPKWSQKVRRSTSEIGVWMLFFVRVQIRVRPVNKPHNFFIFST